VRPHSRGEAVRGAGRSAGQAPLSRSSTWLGDLPKACSLSRQGMVRRGRVRRERRISTGAQCVDEVGLKGIPVQGGINEIDFSGLGQLDGRRAVGWRVTNGHPSLERRRGPTWLAVAWPDWSGREINVVRKDDDSSDPLLFAMLEPIHSILVVALVYKRRLLASGRSSARSRPPAPRAGPRLSTAPT
jgi:hypothetical protein